LDKQRLTKLAGFLERFEDTPTKKFDMNTWGTMKPLRGTNKRNVSLDSPVQSLEVKCKTAACALGWATTIPEFAKAGLKLDIDIAALIDGSDEITGDVVYKGATDSIEAAAKFFDITYEEADIVFGADNYEYGISYSNKIKPQMVAKKIRQLLKEKTLSYRQP
jgi:hypothetical protein